MVGVTAKAQLSGAYARAEAELSVLARRYAEIAEKPQTPDTARQLAYLRRTAERIMNKQEIRQARFMEMYGTPDPEEDGYFTAACSARGWWTCCPRSPVRKGCPRPALQASEDEAGWAPTRDRYARPGYRYGLRQTSIRPGGPGQAEWQYWSLWRRPA